MFTFSRLYRTFPSGFQPNDVSVEQRKARLYSFCGEGGGGGVAHGSGFMLHMATCYTTSCYSTTTVSPIGRADITSQRAAARRSKIELVLLLRAAAQRGRGETRRHAPCLRAAVLGGRFCAATAFEHTHNEWGSRAQLALCRRQSVEPLSQEFETKFSQCDYCYTTHDYTKAKTENYMK